MYGSWITDALTNGLAIGTTVNGVSVTSDYAFASATDRPVNAETAAATAISHCENAAAAPAGDGGGAAVPDGCAAAVRRVAPRSTAHCPARR